MMEICLICLTFVQIFLVESLGEKKKSTVDEQQGKGQQSVLLNTN